MKVKQGAEDSWFLMTVYGSLIPALRHSLWNLLKDCSESMVAP